MSNQVVIIGGGVAGLGCASALNAAGIPFTLITKDVGGRITENSNHTVNYGAYYITADYNHILPLVKRLHRISLLNFQFHHPGQAYSMLGLRAMHYLPQLLRFRQLLRTFRQHLRQLRQDALDEEQSVLIKRDPYLWPLVNQAATDFVREHHLVGLFHDYIEEALYATDFISLAEAQAFDMLWLAQPLIARSYEYSFDPTTITQPFQSSIVLATVATITPQADGYTVATTDQQSYASRYVVVAVPTMTMRQLLHTNDGKEPVSAYMYHLQGQLKPAYAKRRYHVFDDHSRLVTIATQPDGTYLIYTRTPWTDFSTLFSNYTMITQKVWDPAFNVIGSALTKQNRGHGLYVAGEHNICTLEDSYISGVYAARQIASQF
ncbi:MAG: FAD-dependent oxidoreductase [Candidatus Kerfeldbacteria bacterium]|nr:FAD-dependent oxidoreductase [Candidatus Kerfeldbacteria bacterium]